MESFQFELLREAGVKPRHISRLLGVSRVTASNWLRGVTQPHHLIRASADELLSATRAAMEDGRLPVPDQLPLEERSVRTAATVKKYMLKANCTDESTDDGANTPELT
ncbi:MAG: hypothetical protein HOA06_10095 [Chloroflexi bacterium]|jgi:hypothetical protein|nr:hypothetical protein [Chloroflexota bacterium]MBT7538643.1 hypothetical protein [Gammaproteobacteria bacterium]